MLPLGNPKSEIFYFIRIGDDSMKHIIGIILAILVGGLIGFFGVLVSVFADSSYAEQLITIGIILVIYAVLSGLCSLLLQKYSWR